MNRSQQRWLKTFIQDVMDEKGQDLFNNLTWFAKKLCSVMTSASACEHMWSIEEWIHNKRRNRLSQPNVEKAVRAHGNLVLRKAMLLSREQKSHGTRRHASVNRTGTQTSKVLTTQMMMTLIAY